MVGEYGPRWLGTRLNSLPNNKILSQSKLKAFADHKINATYELKFAFGTVENIVVKREHAGYQQFLLFPQCFQMASFSWSLSHIITKFFGHLDFSKIILQKNQRI